MSRAMRILMICPQFRPIVGGYERSAERLAKALAQRGHQVEIWAERREPTWPATEVDDGVIVRRHFSLFRPGVHSASTLASFATAFLRWGRAFDLYHLHQVCPLSAAAIVFGKILGKPVVLKTVSTGTKSMVNLLRHGRFSPLMMRIHRHADAIASSSLATRRDALELGLPADRVFHIGNGVDPTLYRPQPPPERESLRRSLGIRASRVVVFVGRLSEEKQPLLLLDAWRRVAPSATDAELVYVGDGPQSATLRERTEEVASTVRLVGATDNVLPWYQAADLFALPSSREGFSNSLLEAMSCALPVVSTRVSGSTDVFQMADIGDMVDVGDVSGLAEAIRRMLISDERRRVCGESARQLVIREFSMNRVAERAEAMYSCLLQRRTRG